MGKEVAKKYTYIEVVLRPLPNCVLALSQPLEYHSVGAFAVEPDFAVALQYHRHALPHVVKVEDAEELVGLLLAVEGHGDAARRSAREHETEIPRGRHERVLVGTLGLILENAVALVLGHDGVTERQQAKEFADVRVAVAHFVQQSLVEELEGGLVHRIGREIDFATGLIII